MTGRIPIRSALSIVVAPGDQNSLRKETPTIAEFFKKNGYQTYFSGKWHLGDKPDSYPIEHGFDEMKSFGAYYPGVYTYSYTNSWFHPWFPSYNPQFSKEYFDRKHLRLGRRRWQAHNEGHGDHLGLSRRVRSEPDPARDRLHQGACQG
jgi:arylsulfatase A-like enzyme